MTDQERLEKLQDEKRVQCYGLCSDEEKAMYETARAAGKLKYLRVSSDPDHEWLTCHKTTHPDHERTYLIDPDFTLEPDYEYLPIERRSPHSLLGVFAKAPFPSCDSIGFYTIADILAHPQFRGFFTKGHKSGMWDNYTYVDSVARWIAEGHQVVAKMEKAKDGKSGKDAQL